MSATGSEILINMTATDKAAGAKWDDMHIDATNGYAHLAQTNYALVRVDLQNLDAGYEMLANNTNINIPTSVSLSPDGSTDYLSSRAGDPATVAKVMLV